MPAAKTGKSSGPGRYPASRCSCLGGPHVSGVIGWHTPAASHSDSSPKLGPGWGRVSIEIPNDEPPRDHANPWVPVSTPLTGGTIATECGESPANHHTRTPAPSGAASASTVGDHAYKRSS